MGPAIALATQINNLDGHDDQNPTTHHIDVVAVSTLAALILGLVVADRTGTGISRMSAIAPRPTQADPPNAETEYLVPTKRHAVPVRGHGVPVDHLKGGESGTGLFLRVSTFQNHAYRPLTVRRLSTGLTRLESRRREADPSGRLRKMRSRPAPAR